MLRLFPRLLALLALLLAPLPAAAAAAPTAVTVASAATQHCEDSSAVANHHNGEEPDQDEKSPCCKDSMSGCCPVAVPFAGAASPERAEATKPSHLASAEIFALGTSRPPLTEPPTLA